MLLTRSRADNARLAALLGPLGFPVLALPATRAALVMPEGGRDGLVRDLRTADVLAFTSRRGVLALRGLLGRETASLLARPRVAAVGVATASLLRRLGIEPAFVGTQGAAVLGDLLTAGLSPGTRVLLLRAVEAPDVPARSLREAGLLVDDRRVYRQIPPPSPPACPERVAAIVCASPSAARRILCWQPSLLASPFVAIGATTAAALAGMGASVILEASSPTPEALCAAVLKATSHSRTEPR